MKKFKAPSLKRLTKRLEIRPLQMRDDRAWMASHCAMLPPRSPWEVPRIPIKALTFARFMQALEEQKAEAERDQRYTLGLFHKEVGTLLGYLFIGDISRGEVTTATLDFRLINIYWGNGFAKEAIGEAQKLKTALKLDKLELVAKSRAKLKL